MKKLIILFLMLSLMIGVLSACNSSPAVSNSSPDNSQESTSVGSSGFDRQVTGYVELVALTYNQTMAFSDGMCAVIVGNPNDLSESTFGFVDESGTLVIPTIYDWAHNFSEGYAAVQLDGKWGFIDKKGDVIIPLTYDWAHPFSEGLAAVLLNGEWSYIDINGDVVIAFEYAINDVLPLGSFSEGLARVAFQEREGLGKISYIDASGNVILSLDYENAGDFVNGRASVSLDKKWGFIDKEGNEVIAPIYDWVTDFTDDGITATWLAHDPSSSRLPIVSNGKWGYIDKNGEEILPFIYDDAYSFDNGVAVVNVEGKYGYIDFDGNEVLPFVYDNASSFYNGAAIVVVNGKGAYGVLGDFMLIDASGNVIAELPYDIVVYRSFGNVAAVAVFDSPDSYDMSTAKWGFIAFTYD
ncbi:MAG: WG repeat-containing protein [Oscillospiraceae bacterium]|nr:WG repeat-containing protein [Oscillospiraceae bacterium]